MGAGERTYLDYNATAPLRPEADDALARVMSLLGNPSSIHAEGRKARAAIEAAREQVAQLVGAAAKNVIFTSGGTEANNAVLSPHFRRADAPGPSHLVVSAIEHVSVLDGHRFAADAVRRIPVDCDGLIDRGRLSDELAVSAPPPFLASVQVANNETGVVQPIAEIARAVHAAGGLLHADAVQAAGRMPLDISALGVDVLTLSAHKLGGPKGVGAIVFACDRYELRERLVRGGGQERGFRAGTENVSGIVGFGAAAESAARELAGEMRRLRWLRDACQSEVVRLAPQAVVFGAAAERLPNTLAFAVPGVPAETALIFLDLEGVAVSSGSACSSGKVRRSHVLDAMGVAPALVQGAIRLSLGWASAPGDVVRFAAAYEKLLRSLYQWRADAA